MLHKTPLKNFLWCALVFAAVMAARAQIIIDGVTDRATYTDSVWFRVQTNVGFTYEVTLNGQPVPAGISNAVSTMDYYDLSVRRTRISDSSIATALVRFIVLSSRRGDPEKGLVEWFPLPPIPSTAAEVAGAGLSLMTPQNYPAGIDIPVIARVEDETGNERRVNGWLSAMGFEGSTFRILRGAGHGFLPGAAAGSTVSFDGTLQSLQTNKQIQIDASTTWTTVFGILGTTTWPANSRIQVTGNLTIPSGATLTIDAGTVVRLNAGVNITNSGRTVIKGTTTQPVVFTPTATNRVAPEQRGGAWGGWIMRGASAELIANGAIMTGSGAASSFSFSPGTSHKSDQALLLVHSGATVRMTNCALINQAGQVGNGYFSSIVWDHCLIQRAVTCGEYVECTNIINHSALIEFPSVDGIYDATIADADYDDYYCIRGTNYLVDSLLGFAKDDALDSGSGSTGTVLVAHCWIEAALHEALAWSGQGRQVWGYDSVLINCGQGFECGWSGSGGNNSPRCYGGRILSTANSVGARYGDNYSGTTGLGFKDGFLTMTNCIIVHNYRDVWGQVWDDTWNYRTNQMDIHDNYLTAANTNHPNNLVWNPATDASKLLPFMATPPDAPVGIGIALWPNQLDISMLTNGVPVRLSSFTVHPVAVDYTVATPSGTLASGTLNFAPGESVKKILLPPASASGLEIARVTLSNPIAGEITGAGQEYLITFPPGPALSNTTFFTFGATWKYLDDGSNQGTAWRSNSFNDASWPSGAGQLGFGDNDETTLLRSNRTDNTRIATYYFRKALTIADQAQFGTFAMRLLRDDAGIVYFNGREVFRSPNMPSGTVNYDTVTGGSAPPDNTIDTTNIVNSGDLLFDGLNGIACEIHQQSLNSSDISFDLELIGQARAPAPRLFASSFGGELVFYWNDAAYYLEQADEVTGPWSATPGGATSPVTITPSEMKRFYRLRKP